MKNVASTSKAASARPCKVCSSPADCCNFGVDSCKACAAFFRRSVHLKEPLKCNKKLCTATTDDAFNRKCPKCRYDRCIEAGMIPTVSLRLLGIKRDESKTAVVTTSDPRIVLLYRLMANYRDFCKDRLEFETSFIAEEGNLERSPIQMKRKKGHEPFTIYAATYATINSIWKQVAEISEGYLKNSFDEIYSMEEDEQFIILQCFCVLLFLTEGMFRSAISFDKRPLQMFFITYTTVVSYEWADFVRCFVCDELDIKPGMLETFHQLKVCTRDQIVPILDRMELTEIEIIAGVTIAMWAMVSEKNAQMQNLCDRYRKKVLDELQVMYKHDFKLENYATRLGELLTLSNAMLMSSSAVLTELHFFDVFNVFEQESFTSRIVKDVVVKEEPID